MMGKSVITEDGVVNNSAEIKASLSFFNVHLFLLNYQNSFLTNNYFLIGQILRKKNITQNRMR